MTFLVEMLEYRNFGHMTTSAIRFYSRNRTLLVRSWTEIMTPSRLFQSTFILKRPEAANFTYIIKIVTMFTKTALKDSRKKIKRIRNHLLKWNLYLYFLV